MQSPQVSEDILVLHDVYKSYQLGEIKVSALKALSLTLKAGEFTAVVGTSGSGKSTLLNLIGGIDTPDSGLVQVGGEAWADMNESLRSEARNRKIGFIFQSFNLMPMLNVFENVELPLLIQKELSHAERKSRVDKLLVDVGLGEFSKHRPDKLSGGQRQRVAIARALVTKPLIVIADEPTANLDSETTKQIIGLMRDLNEKNKTTFIFSTHDEKLMAHVNRILRMKDGQLVEQI
ncbi:MAG: ABC transporter ATP-binding protein [Proteobacteria bacterium]|nr:MAG: ABC transporter ATP-binding protein [Pseudomonadota bacterium]